MAKQIDMKGISLIAFTLVAGFMARSAHANTSVLSVDPITPGNVFAFENDARRYPKQSEFSIVHSVSMSSESGRRLAVVTVENKASGSRILQADHIMALFADGRRLHPLAFDEGIKLDDGEKRSLTLSFGENEYPILAVYTSLDE
ncbi:MULTISPECIES: hypothetical protein [Pseudoalteromonas]|jgi:hypothetical protein|uniref:DUF4426 domain-containing protein n=2 Tax=Pseudoalteromonas lipolytica TaxID=570156 RepID=A0ABU8SQ98_9GAMM|nr:MULTISPECIES: hypothetical protein [Pseudoalteromonas]MCF2917593.1 hypothetical protein [Pseudoalteromonas sp. Cn5-37]MCH2088483.1 hypothetical protein [Pseudoalteromonas sp.]MED5512911.1 hypothetical protein [Pseudomonadota bacterium]|tara:strand:- start:341 stop:775 length:435 start_codon:yes stop_codon:yes gene_type:complete